MLLTLWWLWMRLRWALWPKPRTLAAQDRVLADRAALVLDRHLAAIPPPEIVGYGHSYSLDPYRTTGPKYVGRTPAIERQLMIAINRTRSVLSKHSVPSHLISALLRDRDPETVANSKKVEAEVKAEAAAEKVERAKKGPMLPPELPSTPPPALHLKPRPEPSSGAGGSKGTP